MQVTINQSTLELVQGDITKQDVDAIVNAAKLVAAWRWRSGWRDSSRGGT
jgi:hypothetical protein